MSNGCSGISTTFAPPAMPACRAIQPACRPITSTTRTRWCDSAVVCSRSIASIAMFTAVSNPKVKSVPERSLSIVFGTPTTLTPRSASLVATPRVSSPPMAISASTPLAARLSLILSTPFSILNGLVREDFRIVPPRGRMPRTCATPSSVVIALQRPAPAVEEADELEAVLGHALADDGADDRVQARAVATASEHSDAHGFSSVDWIVHIQPRTAMIRPPRSSRPGFPDRSSPVRAVSSARRRLAPTVPQTA